MRRVCDLTGPEKNKLCKALMPCWSEVRTALDLGFIEGQLPRCSPIADLARVLVSTMVGRRVTLPSLLSAIPNDHRGSFLELCPFLPWPSTTPLQELPTLTVATSIVLPEPHHLFFYSQIKPPRIIRSLSMDKTWKRHPMIRFVKPLFGDDFAHLINTSALFCEALSFAYRDVGSPVQRGLVRIKIPVDTPENERLFTAICECSTISITAILGNFVPSTDLIPALRTAAFLEIRRMMNSDDRGYYGSATNHDAITDWVDNDTSRRIPFMEFIRAARLETDTKYFPNCLPTLTEFLLQFNYTSDDKTMAEAGVVSTAPPTKSVTTMSAGEVQALVAAAEDSAVAWWAKHLYAQEITGDFLADLTNDNLKEIDSVSTMGSRMALLRWIANLS